MNKIDDPFFNVICLSKTTNPELVAWQAMHQDYSEDFVPFEEHPDDPGGKVVKHLLKGGRGHYGPLEHNSITLAVGFFPHSVIQQARTHRIGTSWDVQSMRYTGKRVCGVATGEIGIEEVFYVRPVGDYTDRHGKKYTYSEHQRNFDLQACEDASFRYLKAMGEGLSEEHARGLLPFDYRQNFVVTFNMRSLMHFLDLRAKPDAQAEIVTLCDLMLPIFQSWAPNVYLWYMENRFAKARLAP